jgi:hypothetical protein
MSRGDWYRCQQKMSDGASLREEQACPDCPLTKNRPVKGLERLVEFSTIFNGSTTRKFYKSKIKILAQVLRKKKSLRN